MLLAMNIMGLGLSIAESVGLTEESHVMVLISVKKELNRLDILGTLITWFASYPVKSS